MTEEAVEAVARALFDDDLNWFRFSDEMKEPHRRKAERAITAYLATEPGEVGLLREAVDYFMRAYDGIAADSFDGVEYRYVLLLREGHSRGRLAALAQPAENAELVALREAFKAGYEAGVEDEVSGFLRSDACEVRLRQYLSRAALSAPGGDAK